MKKKLGVLFALLAITCSSYSQSSLGGKIGINASNINYPSSINNPSYIYGLNAGIVGSYAFNSKISGQIELLYSMQGYEDRKTFIEKDGSISGMKLRLHYINVPILAKLYPFNSGVNIQIGPQLGLMIARQLKLDKESNTDRSIRDKQIFDFGLCIGLGYDFNNNIFIDSRYLLGINSIYKNVDTFQNRCFQLSIGYKFAL